MPRRTLDEAETMIARQHSELRGHKLRADKFYMRTRTLEVAIKKHARRECDCKGPGECLTRLVALTPANDRPSLRQLHNRRMGVR
jgi:hypothetical protein